MKNAVHYPSKNGRKNITKYILNSLIMQLIYIEFFNNAIYRVFINHLIFYFLFTHPGVGEHFVTLKLWKKWECYFREYTAIQLMKKVYNVHTFTCNSLCTLHNYQKVTCQTQVIMRITGNRQHFEKNQKYCTIFHFP